jgi:hypothetical protein
MVSAEMPVLSLRKKTGTVGVSAAVSASSRSAGTLDLLVSLVTEYG